MCLLWLANVLLIYSYVEANKNSQTPVTGPGAVLQEYSRTLRHGLSVCSKIGEISFVYYSQTLLKTAPPGPCLIPSITLFRGLTLLHAI